MGSILKQLALSGANGGVHHSVWDEFLKRVKDAEQDGLDPTPLSLDECQSLIIMITSDYPVTIIIDGLDETEGDIRDLLDAFRLIIEESQNIVKLFVSSRDNMDTPVDVYLQDAKLIQITSADNIDDISAFVKSTVNAAVRNKRLLGGRVSTNLQNRIIEMLIQGSGAMFLWASLHLEQLCDPRFALEDDVNKELEALKIPQTLRSTLEQMYERVENYAPGAKHTTRTIFGWLLISERRLSRSELLNVISLTRNIGEDDCPSYVCLLIRTQKRSWLMWEIGKAPP
ncbi:ankyrin repeat protein [Colletotrichum tofieldiae]|nr:ankyrin repeat protein [Colletotrichum tofieldiae]